jgi:DNA transformation protein
VGVSKSQIEYVIGQLEKLGPVTAKKMFGGAGLYADGVIFGLIDSQDVFYLKANDSNRADYEERGQTPFNPYGDDRPAVMPYMTVPEDVLEDPDELAAWARKSVSISAKAKR